MMVLCAVLGGIEDWVGMETFAEGREAWLRSFLELPDGIPSHDTSSDVLGRIDPVAFRAAVRKLSRKRSSTPGRRVRLGVER